MDLYIAMLFIALKEATSTTFQALAYEILLTKQVIC